MIIRTMLFTLVACASTASMPAFAHPGAHDDEKLIPTTCTQLADTERYINDVSYPQVKELKARCDAGKERGTELPSTTKTQNN